jgi:hypothetical protein
MEKSNTKAEIKEVLGQLSGWEQNKIWRTIKGLTLTPGKTIKEYCEGEHAEVVNPITYYLLLFAFTSYLNAVTGLEAELEKNGRELITSLGSQFNFEISKGSIENAERSSRFLSTEIANSLLLIPFALLLRWSIFRSFNSSFKFNSWFELFTMGQSLIITGLPGVVWWSVTGDTFFINVLELSSIIYILWATKQFYDLTIRQALLYTLIYFVLLAIITSVVSAVSGAIFTLIDFIF